MPDSLVRRSWRRYRAVPIVYRIAVAFVLGATVGLAVGPEAAVLAPLGELFLRLLQMLVVPIIVFTLLTGVRRLSPTRFGRVGGTVVGLYMLTTGIAAAIGLTLANLFDPGTGLTLSDAEAQSAEAPGLTEVVLGIVPRNPLGAMANGDLLAIIFFVVVFGVALAYVRDTTDEEGVADSIDGFFGVMDAGAAAMFAVVWGVMEYGVSACSRSSPPNWASRGSTRCSR